MRILSSAHGACSGSTRTVLSGLHGSRFRFARGVSSDFFGLHRACNLAWVTFISIRVKLISARGVRFPSFEVGNPNFSQYSELVMIWNLIDFDGEAMRILIGLN